MTGHEPADDEGPAFEQAIGEGGDSRRDRVRSTIRRRAGNGTLALLAGGVMLARAARAIPRSRRRALARAVAGTGLIAIGVRQRRSAGADRHPAAEGPATADTGGSGVTFTEQPDVDRPGTGSDEEFGSGSETGDEEIGIDVTETESTDEADTAGSGDDESGVGATGSETERSGEDESQTEEETEAFESGTDDEPSDEDDQ